MATSCAWAASTSPTRDWYLLFFPDMTLPGSTTAHTSEPVFDGAKLHRVEAVIHAALCQKLVMAAGFDDAALIHHDHQAGFFDRREPVSDDERCAPSQ